MKKNTKNLRAGFATSRLLVIALMVVAVVGFGLFVWMQKDNLSKAEEEAEDPEIAQQVTESTTESQVIDGLTIPNTIVGAELCDNGSNLNKYVVWVCNNRARVWACRISGNPRDGIRFKAAFNSRGRVVRASFGRTVGGIIDYDFSNPNNAVYRGHLTDVIRYNGNQSNPKWALMAWDSDMSYTWSPKGKFRGEQLCGNDWNRLTSGDYRGQ